MRPITSFQSLRQRRSRFGIRTQRGVSLLEMVGIVAALMALVVSLSYKTADFFNKSQAIDSDALLHMADNQLRQYIVANGRLPCPDLDGSGISADTCTTADKQKGYLPYKTLGMADKNYVFGEVPMLYGAYNDGSIALTSALQTFRPSYASTENVPVPVTTERNMFDFCKSLSDLKRASAAASGLAVTNTNESLKYTTAYALALPGQANRDGLAAGWGGPSINAQYDGLNATSPNRFELPQAPITPTYDDQTHYRTASDLHDYFRCEAMNSSVNLLIEAVTVQKETEDFANMNSKNVEFGLIMNSALNALSLYTMYTANAQNTSAGVTLGISAGLLAGVSATCPIPPFVACALIPVYATAVAAATTGGSLAVGATAAAVVSLGLQITATVLYAELNGRTTTPHSTPAAVISDVSDTTVANLKTAYVTSKGLAQTAYNAVPTPAPNVTVLNGTQRDKANLVATEVSKVTDTTLNALLSAGLKGSVSTCTLASTTACLSGGFTLHGPDVIGNYSKDLLDPTYTPGVIPSLDTYYSAILQSGASTSTGVTLTSTSTDPAVLAAQQSLADANAALAAVPVVDPATALADRNRLVAHYNALLAAIADFDEKNLAVKAASNATTQAARDTSLATLRTLLGSSNSAWDYTGTTTLCGGGSTTASSCGWMKDITASAGSAPPANTPLTAGNTTLASTASSVVNDYLTAYGDYKNTAVYQKFKDAADAKAKSAWSDRNGYKTALCAKIQSASFLGSSSTSSTNPTDWDVTETLLGAAITNLNCTSTGTAPDFSSNQSAALAAEKTKYCTTGTSTYDAGMCSIVSGTRNAISTIQGAQNIVDALIIKGIVK